MGVAKHPELMHARTKLASAETTYSLVDKRLEEILPIPQAVQLLASLTIVWREVAVDGLTQLLHRPDWSCT